MKKIMKAIENLSVREIIFLSISCLMSGIVIGILLSPKGKRVIGSHNGNHNSGYVYGKDEEIKKRK